MYIRDWNAYIFLWVGGNAYYICQILHYKVCKQWDQREQNLHPGLSSLLAV